MPYDFSTRASYYFHSTVFFYDCAFINSGFVPTTRRMEANFEFKLVFFQPILTALRKARRSSSVVSYKAFRSWFGFLKESWKNYLFVEKKTGLKTFFFIFYFLNYCDRNIIYYLHFNWLYLFCYAHGKTFKQISLMYLFLLFLVSSFFRLSSRMSCNPSKSLSWIFFIEGWTLSSFRMHLFRRVHSFSSHKWKYLLLDSFVMLGSSVFSAIFSN